MIKVLEDAIEKIRRLPEDRQAYAAEVLEQLVADADAGLFEIPDEHMEGVLEGLAQARRGEFASETEVDAVLRKPWR
jgi:predicted transcriptional regulator